MILLSPLSLLFLISIPVIITLHLIRRQRTELEISSTYLWEEVLREYKRRFFLQTLMRNLPLILQILAVILLSLGIANFMIPGKRDEARDHTIVVLDTSASMKTSMGSMRGGTRFEEAKKQAREYIQSLPDRSQVMLVTGASTPSIVYPFTQDTYLLREILDGLSVTDEPGDMEKVLFTTAGLPAPSLDAKIVLFSDGAFDLVNGDLISTIPIDYKLVGRQGENVGITGFEFRKPLNRKYEYEIMIRLMNYGALEYIGTLNIDGESGRLLTEHVTLGPSEEQTLILPYNGLLSEQVKALLLPSDHFGTDNTAYAVFSDSGKVHVHLITPGNFFLEQLLSVHPNISLTVNDTDVPDDAITIYDREYPPANASGRYMLIGVLQDSLKFESMGIQENPKITGWDIDHPITGNLNLSDIAIYRSIRVSRDHEFTSIIHSGEYSLAYVYEDGDRALFGLNFAIAETDLPLRTVFPILVNNALTWLYPGALGEVGAQATTGQVYTVSVPPGTDSVTIHDPQGETWSEPVHDGYARITNLRYAGFYTAETPDGRRLFAANLMDENESNIAPRFSIPEIEEPSAGIRTGSSDQGRVYKPMWIILVLIAFALLFAEWLFWIRRRV